VSGVRGIAAPGATLHDLPPYSPDLNPIEKLFAALKALLRQTAPRTLEMLWQQIAQLLDPVSPTECAHYFASSGTVRS
jgi:transposase